MGLPGMRNTEHLNRVAVPWFIMVGPFGTEPSQWQVEGTEAQITWERDYLAKRNKTHRGLEGQGKGFSFSGPLECKSSNKCGAQLFRSYLGERAGFKETWGCRAWAPEALDSVLGYRQHSQVQTALWG